jgi:hypothetical protein
MGVRVRNKGQVFLIMAVIFIVILVILRININLTEIIQGGRKLEGNFEKDFFVNVVNELPKVIEISYYQSNNITNNVYNFGNFTRKKMTEKMQEFEFLFVGSITPRSSGSDTMNVSVVNLLNKPINLTLTLNNTIPPTLNNDNMVDYSSYTTSFVITQGTHYILTVGYNGTYEENITIVTESGKSKYVGFFDVTLTGKETTYKDKFQKSYTLP